MEFSRKPLEFGTASDVLGKTEALELVLVGAASPRPVRDVSEALERSEVVRDLSEGEFRARARCATQGRQSTRSGTRAHKAHCGIRSSGGKTVGCSSHPARFARRDLGGFGDVNGMTFAST
jgi:hypothetical protein